MKTAIYAGSFDPITLGHVWVINQALAIFDKVYIAIGTNPDKKTTFDLAKRIEMIRNAFPNEPKIEVIDFEHQFLVNFCRNHNIDVMVRGIRNVKDLEYETQILYINEKISKQIKTVYFIPPTELAGLSSSMVKGLVGFPAWRGVVDGLVPEGNGAVISDWYYSERVRKHDIPSVAPDEMSQVMEAYSARNRHYHTLQHLDEMIGFLRKYMPISSYDWRSWAIYHAAVYHDFVYDPLASDNEQKSVEVFRKNFVQRGHSSPALNEQARFISSLILATKSHEGDSPIHNIFIDADLAVLGASPDRFWEYESQIRKEYSMVSDEKYRKGRADFVRGMLERNTIFLDERVIAEKEEQARNNLKALLEKLV